MKSRSCLALFCAASFSSMPVAAQTEVAASAAPVLSVQCELHVFPTENYIGLNTGLLSGFGIVGALADNAAHKDRVLTVTDLMKGYLGPDIQMEELNKIGLLKTLGLSSDYQIIVEAPTPSSESVKADPAVKAKVKAMNADLKAGKRMSASTAPCYTELLLTSIFYHKAMMYGSNLFVGTMLRDYGNGRALPVVSKGWVKNPLENFPPKTPEMVDAAKLELRDAFSKDFIEWSQKKRIQPVQVSQK